MEADASLIWKVTMFYSNQVLNRKGPLAMVWLAAHMDNKLRKNKVFDANLVGSIGITSVS